MRSQLFPALYDTRWYNGWIFDHDEGFMGNRELFMVGMPRLRQIRIKPGNLCSRYLGYYRPEAVIIEIKCRFGLLSALLLEMFSVDFIYNGETNWPFC